MEFEMEMDIPHPDELQWLEESNALMLEEEDQAQFLDEDDQLLDLCEATPEEEEPPGQTIGKRNRSEDPTDVTEYSDKWKSAEKRSRSDDVTSFGAEDGDEEEDWFPKLPKKKASVEGAGDAEVFSGEFVVQEEKTLSRFALEIDGDYVPVTGPCGDRVYAKMCSGMVDLGNKNGSMYTPSNGLLLEPINVLMERLEEENLKKVLEESFGSPTDPTNSMAPTFKEKLWVEKYSPICFTELLSDEKINREVLLWLKQWDSSVFGSHIRATSDDVLSDLRRHSTLAHQARHNKFSKSFSNNNRVYFNNRELNNSNIMDKNSSLQETLDSWSKNRMLSLSSPPEQKVLLLCGPPGLGKTTLAHVAAKHCGYRVVEINASDERSSSTIESKILDVVQMNSVMGDSKPKCLVIDEIDGALGEGKGAVDVILKMVLAEKKSNHENNDLVERSGKSSRKARKTIKLTRPVICICNDLYAPALRPLRGIAKVHKFVQPTISRVVSRVNYICKLEGFKTNSSALSALAGYTECDIRSCLNTLQFLHKKKETLNFLEIDPQVVGRKDISRTAYDVWKEVFQKRKAKHEKKSGHISSVSGDFDFMHSLISNRGEYELTMDGIYENFLQLSYHDPLMHKTISCLDNLGISDSLLRYMMQTQQMSLNAYQPFYAISMKNIIAQVDRPNIEWPSSIQRYRVALRERKELLKLWQSKISPSISRHMSVESFVEDVVTPLLHILSPPSLRPVALHLLSESEKDGLSQLVDTMVSYSITYKNSKIEHAPKTKYGACSDIQLLCLDPSIDNFICFKDYQPGYNAPPLAIKQLLVHEVENQRILRESTGKSLNQNSGSSSSKSTPPNGRTGTFSEKTNMVAVSSGKEVSMQSTNKTSDANRSYPAVGHKLRNVPGASKKSSHRSNDFFDKFRKHCKDSKNSEKALLVTTKRDSRPFLFKYNEGFTNAVKRPVRMRELFLK